jgi:CHAD domain-containing protein
MADGKWIPGLTPAMSVEEAARAILAARLDVVRQYLPLAVEHPFDDPENVHQLRVGTRRAAAALRVFKDWLPKKHRKATRDHLRTIRQAAGDARDWDVFLINLRTAPPLHTAAGKPALDFLRGYALGERCAAQARLAEAAEEAGPGFAKAAAALPDRVRAADADDPPATLGDLATAQLGALLAAFTDAVRADPSEPADLHQLRILGKRVRYAMELFADCFAPPLREALYPTVESLQESLGELQDAAVSAVRLETLRERTEKVEPDEWPRLRRGITGLIRSARAKLPAGRARFRAWREDWEKLRGQYPLESLRPVPGQPVSGPGPDGR